jgi:hypothetical protein
MKTTHSEAQHWWSNLSTGERRLICAVINMLNGPRLCRRPAAETFNRRNRTPLKDLIRATSNWESGIGCFLKLRIIHQRPFRLAPSPWLRIEGKSSPPKKPIVKPAPLPIRWSDSYTPRGRNLCQKSSANRNSKIKIQKSL